MTNISGGRLCMRRARRLFLQQAPLEVLVDELKTIARATPEGSWVSLPFQEKVVRELLGSAIAEEYPPRPEYVSRLTKLLLDDCDTAGEEASEGLLRARMACVSTSQTAGRGFETAFESYWLPRRRTDDCCPSLGHPRHFVEAYEEGAFASFRVANRDNEVGMRVWEAGRALAEFCVAHARWLEGKSVLELGAGVGMTGAVVAACCGAREVILTDYAPRVINNLRFNVDNNRSVLRGLLANGCSGSSFLPAEVSVRSLDWTDYMIGFGTGPAQVSPLQQQHQERENGDHSDWRENGRDALGAPEVILAADVVYDNRYHPALVGVVREALRRRPDTLVLFASTLRNAETMAAFHQCLQDAGIPWRSVDFFPRGGGQGSLPSSQGGNGHLDGVFRDDLDGHTVDKDAFASRVGHNGHLTCGEQEQSDHGPTPTPVRGRGDSGLLWCSPGELERVRFCVCGSGFQDE